MAAQLASWHQPKRCRELLRNHGELSLLFEQDFWKQLVISSKQSHHSVRTSARTCVPISKEQQTVNKKKKGLCYNFNAIFVWFYKIEHRWRSWCKDWCIILLKLPLIFVMFCQMSKNGSATKWISWHYFCIKNRPFLTWCNSPRLLFASLDL